MIPSVSELDEQHRRWIEIINERHDSMMAKKVAAAKTTDQILGRMIDYANFHFAFEEDYMKRIDHADLKKHRYQHEFFTKTMTAKLDEELACGSVVNSELIGIMTSWLRNHILLEDQKLNPPISSSTT